MKVMEENALNRNIYLNVEHLKSPRRKTSNFGIPKILRG